MYVSDIGRTEVIQFIAPEITLNMLREALREIDIIYTYNGTRFDLPFLKNHLGIDLGKDFIHHDLMLDCWRRNLYGGLKAVERILGIPRRLKTIDGQEAVRLWLKYEKRRDYDALSTLLEYNREDVLNLKTLKGLVCGTE
jgi:uncharacterized protein YprB with RNaseH-like and TPR domain